MSNETLEQITKQEILNLLLIDGAGNKHKLADVISSLSNHINSLEFKFNSLEFRFRIVTTIIGISTLVGVLLFLSHLIK